MAVRKIADEVIAKGADVVQDNKPKNKWTNFCLRITKNLSEEIDECLEKRVGLSKTAWILEAVMEKLQK